MINEKVLCIFVNLLIVSVQSAKILGIFSAPSISHHVVFRKITGELIKRGHEVTVVTADPEFSKNESPKNLTEIDIHDISYDFARQMSETSEKHIDINDLDKYSDEKTIKLFMSKLFEAQLKSPQLQNLLFNKNQKFDLLLIEGISRPALAVSYIFEAPVILVCSYGATVGINEAIGAATHPRLYPSPFSDRLYNLTLVEKVKVIYKYYWNRYNDYLLEKDENVMLQKYFGSDIPPLSTLYNNVDMLFVNVHPIWADNQPVPPSVVFMGGIHQHKTKQLPKELKTYLDSSKRGVIYFSLGSNVPSAVIPQNIVNIFIIVLSEQPYDILWKWDLDELPIKTSNIKLSKWLPQADVLKHPKIKLFITQAGLQSTDEAITAGVPLVAIPFLSDQWYNAEKYVHHGIGKMLRIQNLDAEMLKNAVDTVINDISFRQNILMLRKIMLDRPEPPLNRAMWWIEYILRHGNGKHLRSPTANITWAQYFELDLILIFSSLVMFSFITTTMILVCAIKNIMIIFTNKGIKIKNA